MSKIRRVWCSTCVYCWPQRKLSHGPLLSHRRCWSRCLPSKLRPQCILRWVLALTTLHSGELRWLAAPCSGHFVRDWHWNMSYPDTRSRLGTSGRSLPRYSNLLLPVSWTLSGSRWICVARTACWQEGARSQICGIKGSPMAALGWSLGLKWGV